MTHAADSPEVIARIKECLDLVDMLARSMHAQMGPYAELDDLASFGREALVNAARSWDVDRGVPFRKWAALRIRGALMEAMRSRGPLPKRVYRKLRAMQAAERIYEVVAEEDAAAPVTTAEAADERLAETLASAAAAMAIGFLRVKSGDALDRVRDEDGSPEDLAAESELARILREVIAERPQAEQTLLVRHYFEDVTFEDAAKDLGLSKSWASRLHARAIEGVSRSLKRRRFAPP